MEITTDYAENPGDFHVRGNTYIYRDTLKRMGGKYDPELKAWKFERWQQNEVWKFIESNSEHKYFDGVSTLHTDGTLESYPDYKARVRLTLSEVGKRKCGICREEGHDRRTCDFQKRKTQADPKWKRMLPFGRCSCTDETVCVNCQHLCCEKAMIETCVCRLCFSCSEHKIERCCIGTHD